MSVVHLRGGAGQVVFVFADGLRQEGTLLLEHGIRMPVALGDQPVGWYLVNVDLRGAGRLDYANLCPFAIVNRSMLVMHGPARAPVYLSINGSPIEAVVPTGISPLVLKHQRVTIVICNQEQIDQTYYDSKAVHVGVAGFDVEGNLLQGNSSSARTVTSNGEIERTTIPSRSGRRSAPITLSDWQVSGADAYISGTSPRFATLEGPETLATCGASLGYGWYRIQFKSSSSRRRRLHLPYASDRAHLFLDGKFTRVVGVGRGADHRSFDEHLARGPHTIVALLDNLGRFSEGNDLGEPKGLYGHIYEVKKLAAIKPQPVTGTAVDPFKLRGYIAGRTLGQLSDTKQARWSFTHARKTPILVEVDGATASGTFVLNDQLLTYYAGASGGCLQRILLLPGQKPFKRGKNELRFAPDPRQGDAVAMIGKKTTLFECVESISDPAAWSFAKWEPPLAATYQPMSRTAARALRSTPCWWRTAFEVSQLNAPLRIETTGLSKGQAFINGHNVGRYFVATADGHPVGPQRRLYVPPAWIKLDEPNELLLFDEHGFTPHRTRIVFTDADE